MASTLYLKLVKVTSEHDASKVATYNTVIDEIDAAIGGMLTLNVAGSANVTLTRVQALNKYIEFTGALTGNISVYLPVITNLALTPPTTTIGSVRELIVTNSTTGGFTLTVKTSAVGSTGVAVTQTKTVNLVHNGTNVRATSAEV